MSRLLALLVLASAVLAGCAQPAAVLPDAAPLAAAPSDPFHPPIAGGADSLVEPTPGEDVLVATPGPAEPNVAVAHDGTLFVANPEQVWRSDDRGATWTETGGKGIEGGGDADIALDANGTLYYLGLFGEQDRAIPFLTSKDKGETWSPAIDVSAGSGFDREWMDVTPDGRVYATWRGETGIEFNMSPDGGRTWLPSVVTVGKDGDGGPVIHDPATGLLAVPVIDLASLVGTEGAHSYVYTSADEGQTWTQHETAVLGRTSPVEPNGYASDFPVVAFDGAGTMYLVYSAPAAGADAAFTPPEEIDLYGIWMQVSRDQGETWSAPMLLSDPTKDARFPWIAAGAPGRVAVVWYQNVNGVPGEMLPDQWHVMLHESITADQDAPEGVTVQLTTKPNHLGSLCTSGTGCLAADRSLLDFFEVAIDLQGQPVVAFASSDLGTGIGIAVRRTEVHFITVTGTSLL